LQRCDFNRIALLNFGGIGDEILFSPVITAVKSIYPQANMTLILEKRSQAIQELIPQIDETIGLDLTELPRWQVFVQLLSFLKNGQFDAVISSGSTPFIPVLLWLSQIPIRVGFDTGRISRFFLTHPAPLNRKRYAGEMYFALAQAFLCDQENTSAIPHLTLSASSKDFARKLLYSVESKMPRQRILIHPGVSRMSVQKNILKAWPIDYWADLLHQLPIRYPEANLYLLGGPDDADVIADLEAIHLGMAPDIRQRVINLYGQTESLLDLAAIIDQSDLLISVDSAPMHLAIGLETAVVALFSPTDEVKLLPQSANAVACVRDDLPCRPCLWDVRKTSCETPLCLDIPVALVMKQVESLLKP